MEDDQQVVQLAVQVSADGDLAGHGRGGVVQRGQGAQNPHRLVQDAVHIVDMQQLAGRGGVRGGRLPVTSLDAAYVTGIAEPQMDGC